MFYVACAIVAGGSLFMIGEGIVELLAVLYGAGKSFFRWLSK